MTTYTCDKCNMCPRVTLKVIHDIDSHNTFTSFQDIAGVTLRAVTEHMFQYTDDDLFTRHRLYEVCSIMFNEYDGSYIALKRMLGVIKAIVKTADNEIDEEYDPSSTSTNWTQLAKRYFY